MTRPLWLHIGAPKAGSTALQRWCLTNRAALIRAGLIYPGREERHQAVLSAFHPAPETLAYHRGRGRAEARGFEALRMEGVAADLARHPEATVLLSNEHFLSYANQLDLTALRDWLVGQGDLRVLVYIRDPLAAMVARSFEEVKSGGAELETVFAQAKLLPIGGLETIFRVFGADRIALRSFEAACGSAGDITADVLEQIAPDLDLTETVDIPPQNPTLSLEAAYVLGAYNRAMADTPRPARRLIPENLYGFGTTRFALPKGSILAQKAELEAQYAMLDRLGLPLPRPDWDALPEVALPEAAPLLPKLLKILDSFGPKRLDPDSFP